MDDNMCSEGRYILSPTTICTERQYVPSQRCFVLGLVEFEKVLLEKRISLSSMYFLTSILSPPKLGKENRPLID